MAVIDPSPVLDCARVLAYAEVDESETYIEQGCFYVDGKLLGRVPRLAICQYLDEAEVLIFHCDSDWNSLGAQGGFQSVEEAKTRIVRSYPGLHSKWIDTSVTETQTREFLEQEFLEGKCSFCGRWPYRVKQMIGENVRICNYCIDEFYVALHEDEKV